jgi:hypothetical protein
VFELIRHVDAEERALLGALGRLPSGARLREIPVSPEPGALDAGSRPAMFFKDDSGQRYLFKVYDDDLAIAAEELSCEVRAMGGRPTVAVARRTLTMPELGTLSGMLQPLVDHSGERLSSDPLAWSALQREVLLREHPWEWLLANLDTHADQYILVGPSRHPLNIDWDHTLVDLDVTELSRFTKRGVAIAPIRNLLYDAYANAALRFELWGLRRECARIAALDDRALAAAVERYARAISASDGRRRELVEAMLARKHDLRRTFERLLATMRRERVEAVYGARGLGPRARRLGTNLQDVWQRTLVTVLHERVIRRALKAYRAVNSALARKRH